MKIIQFLWDRSLESSVNEHRSQAPFLSQYFNSLNTGSVTEELSKKT